MVDDSLKLVRALGYDMNSMEWAVRDGIPYAIDFMNPAPDMDIYSLTPHYFEWAISAMADMAIDLAKNPRRQVKELRWDSLFASSREGGGHVGHRGEPAQDARDGSASPSAGTGAETSAAAAAGEMMGSDGRAPAGDSLASGAKELDAATSAGGPTAARNQASGETGFDASASAGTGPSHTRRPGAYVDPSPAADLEPPADAQAQPASTSTADSGGGREVGNGRAGEGHETGHGRGSGSPVESGEKGHGRAAEDRS